MIRQVINPVCEQGNLPFRRSGVGFRLAVLFENLLFYFFRQIHANIKFN
jgi:hypothetical protein